MVLPFVPVCRPAQARARSRRGGRRQAEEACGRLRAHYGDARPSTLACVTTAHARVRSPRRRWRRRCACRQGEEDVARFTAANRPRFLRSPCLSPQLHRPSASRALPSHPLRLLKVMLRRGGVNEAERALAGGGVRAPAPARSRSDAAHLNLPASAWARRPLAPRQSGRLGCHPRRRLRRAPVWRRGRRPLRLVVGPPPSRLGATPRAARRALQDGGGDRANTAPRHAAKSRCAARRSARRSPRGDRRRHEADERSMRLEEYPPVSRFTFCAVPVLPATA